jgi:anti-sigma factor RsiW
MTGEDRNPSKDSVLKRLLGPQGPELSCEECFEELDRYVELELGEADADARIPGMREHLEGCSACAEDHRSLRALVERDIGSPAPLPGD